MKAKEQVQEMHACRALEDETVFNREKCEWWDGEGFEKCIATNRDNVSQTGSRDWIEATDSRATFS